MAGPIRISILANASQARNELNSLSGDTNNLGSKMSSFGKVAAAGLAVAGVAAAGFAVSAVKAASDSQQSIGATETVFGDFADTVIKTSEGAASKYGVSANSYRESANLIGSLFKNQGVSTDQLAGKTEQMVGKAADLAATFGGTTKDAVEALGSAFKGEFDPLEKYGISLKQSTVSAEATALAQQKYGKALEELSPKQQAQIKQQAASNLIMQQSKDTAGAFARESGTLAHQQQVLSAKFEDVKAKVGTALLPILTAAFAFIADVAIPAAEKLGAALVEKMAPAVDAVKAAFDSIQPVIEKVVGFIRDNPETVTAFAVTLGVLAGALVIATGATAAWNAVLALNPIALVVIAIAALVAALVYAYNESEAFRSKVDAVWSFLKNTVPPAIEAIKNTVVSVFNFLKGFISDPIGTIKNVISQGWEAIRAKSAEMWEKVKEVVSTKVGEVVAKVMEIKDKIINFFSSAPQWILNEGRQILGGLISGIGEKFGDLTAKVQAAKENIGQKFSDAISFLLNEGRQIISGLISGIGEKFGDLGSKVGEIKTDIENKFSGALTWLSDTGKNIVQGLINGIKEMAGDAAQAAIDVVKGAIDAAKNLLKLGSPSKLFRQFGEWTGEGLVIGLSSMEKDAAKAAANLAGATESGFGDPRLAVGMDAAGAFSSWSADADQRSRVKITLTAQQLSAIQRGREVQADLDAYRFAGGKARA